MCEIDEIHEAESDAQADCQNEQQHAIGNPVEKNSEQSLGP
jgi:hypothetical protein